jgi:hypothetical protein
MNIAEVEGHFREWVMVRPAVKDPGGKPLSAAERARLLPDIARTLAERYALGSFMGARILDPNELPKEVLDFIGPLTSNVLQTYRQEGKYSKGVHWVENAKALTRLAHMASTAMKRAKTQGLMTQGEASIRDTFFTELTEEMKQEAQAIANGAGILQPLIRGPGVAVLVDGTFE